MAKPTNGELKIMLDNLEHKHSDVMGVLHEIKMDVKETKIQTTKTNGRVTTLETWSEKVNEFIEAQVKKNDITDELKGNWRWLIGIGSTVILLGGTLSALYIKDVAQASARKAIAELEANYQIKIEK